MNFLDYEDWPAFDQGGFVGLVKFQLAAGDGAHFQPRRTFLAGWRDDAKIAATRHGTPPVCSL